MKLEFKTKYKVELAPTLSGHWYKVWKISPKGKEKFIGYYPSSTTILLAYPQSQYLTEWIGKVGWHESQRIKSEAGEKGTRVHAAIDRLEEGYTLFATEYSWEEFHKIHSFVKWYNDYKPELIAKEIPVFSRKGRYAGRLDRIYIIDGQYTLLDFKTSSGIHEHFPLQFASYANAVEENTDIKIVQTAALQLGAKNKNGYRYIVYPDWKEHYKIFKHVKKVWEYEYFDSKINPKKPPVLDLPDKLKLEK